MLNILGLTRFLQLGHIGAWPIVVAIGALPYPITFLCTDLISELWGEEKANQLVWVGLLLNGWVVLILWLGGLLPGLPGSDDSTFRTIQELSFGAIGASMAAYLTAQFIDVRLFHFWKRVSPRMLSIPSVPKNSPASTKNVLSRRACSCLDA